VRSLRNISTAMVAAGLVAACGSATLAPTPVEHGQRSVLPDTSPALAYTMVARQIKACWFKPADPVLPNHVFRAEVPPSGAPDPKTTIVIYDRTPEGKRGLKAYSIEFESRSNGTTVTTANHKLPYALAQKLTADVGHWIQGGANCDGPAPAASGPRVAAAASSSRLSPPRGSF
jgi:hypothetical protein